MKKTILLFSCLLSTVLCIGQNLKEDEEWARLIDYVNSRYVQSYVEQRWDVGLNEKDKNNFTNHIMPSLDGKAIGEALDKEGLTSILTQYGFGKTHDKVVTPLQSKYVVPANLRTLEKALDLSIFDEDVSQLLTNTRESLKSELDYRYKPEVKKEDTPAVSSTKKERREKRAKRETQPREDSDMSWVPYLILLILLACLFFYTRKRTTWERFRVKILDSKSIEDKFAQNVSVDKDFALLRNKIASLESEILNLKALTQKLSAKPSSDVGYRQTKNEVPAAPPKASFPTVFVKNFGEGVLKVVEQSEAEFQLALLSDSSATFTFCGDVSKALANSDGTFDYVSDKIGSVADAKSIITETPGTVLKQEEGKWRVVQKAKIKFV